jgi:prephenate dehydrogenase
MSSFLAKSDVVVLANPLINFQDVVQSLPVDQLRGKLMVVMDVCPFTNTPPMVVLLRSFGPEVDILCLHLMLGVSGSIGTGGSVNRDAAAQQGEAIAKIDPLSTTWDGQVMIYEKVRITDVSRCDRFLKIFEDARCQMVETTADEHDWSIADAEFVTHLTKHLLDCQSLAATPVLSKEYAALREMVEQTAGNLFDWFNGMFHRDAEKE